MSQLPPEIRQGAAVTAEWASQAIRYLRYLRDRRPPLREESRVGGGAAAAYTPPDNGAFTVTSTAISPPPTGYALGTNAHIKTGKINGKFAQYTSLSGPPPTTSSSYDDVFDLDTLDDYFSTDHNSHFDSPSDSFYSDWRYIWVELAAGSVGVIKEGNSEPVADNQVLIARVRTRQPFDEAADDYAVWHYEIEQVATGDQLIIIAGSGGTNFIVTCVAVSPPDGTFNIAVTAGAAANQVAAATTFSAVTPATKVYLRVEYPTSPETVPAVATAASILQGASLPADTNQYGYLLLADIAATTGAVTQYVRNSQWVSRIRGLTTPYISYSWRGL